MCEFVFILKHLGVKLLTPTQALGRRLKELRADAGITQDELAERADLFRTYLSRIESGVANPSFTVLVALAAALEVDAGELFRKPTQESVPGRRRSVWKAT